jgi:hydroxyacylglutathione hydrolase
MYFEQFYLGCLAHASYLLGSKGVGVVIDPQRDVDVYLKSASEHGLTIQHVFETHLHADFVSGHRELAERTGATIYIGAEAHATVTHVAVIDGDEIKFGDCSIRVLETPGHTPESVCLLVRDPERGSDPWAVFTGDTLFIGDVGRPDLSRTHTPEQLAAMMFDSLHQKLLVLPDSTFVYPAHGAGSLCGRNMRADKFSTIGSERLTNYALQIKTREAFVQQLTANLPVRPQYFQENAEINRVGAAPLTDQTTLPGLTPQQVQTLISPDLVLLDTRPVEQFAALHVAGSISISLAGQFASWAGIIIGLHTPVIIIAESCAIAEEARMRLARVGIEKVLGYLIGGIESWAAAKLPVDSLNQATVRDLYEKRTTDSEISILDVRRGPEWEAGHVEGARLYALDDFPRQIPALSTTTVAVHCKGGYRSVIACSLLQRAGYRNVINILGGFDAWTAEELPVSVETGNSKISEGSHSCPR